MVEAAGIEPACAMYHSLTLPLQIRHRIVQTLNTHSS